MTDRVLEGGFVVAKIIRLTVPAGLSEGHGVRPGEVQALFCRPLTQVKPDAGWVPKWGQLVTDLGVPLPLGQLGMMLLWQYCLAELPLDGLSVASLTPNFSSLCGVWPVTRGRNWQYVSQINPEDVPHRHFFVSFFPI